MLVGTYVGRIVVLKVRCLRSSVSYAVLSLLLQICVCFVTVGNISGKNELVILLMKRDSFLQVLQAL